MVFFRTTYTMFGPLARVKTQATFLMIFGTTFAAVLFWIEKGSINEEAGVDLIEGGDSPGFTSVVNAAYFVVVTYVVHKHALTLMWAPFLSPMWMVFLYSAALSLLVTVTLRQRLALASS